MGELLVPVQKYTIRLESPVDGQYRDVTCSAPTEAEAVALAELREQEYCDYSLDWDVAHPRTFLTEAHAAEILSDYQALDTGKIRHRGGGRGHSIFRAKLHQHLQAEPYKVAKVTPVKVDTHRLLAEIARLQQDPDEWQHTLELLRKGGIPLNAVTHVAYGTPIKNLLDGTSVWDFDTDTIKFSLHTAYTLDQDAHDFFNDVSATEVTGTGYTAGGVTLASKTVTYDSASDQARCDAADPTWSSSTISATDGISYKSTGTSSTSPLITAMDFGGTVSSSSGTFTVTLDSTGLIVFDVT